MIPIVRCALSYVTAVDILMRALLSVDQDTLTLMLK